MLHDSRAGSDRHVTRCSVRSKACQGGFVRVVQMRLALAASVATLLVGGCHLPGEYQDSCTPGNMWSCSTTPGVPTPVVTGLNAVWGSGSSDVWAVGSNGTILRWNGSQWSSASSGATYSLSGVWGSGANDVWAVGYSPTILHWNGSQWSSVSSGATYSLLGVWGSGADDVWAVSSDGTIQRWNGSRWSSVSGATHFLSGVWRVPTYGRSAIPGRFCIGTGASGQAP